MEEKFSVYQFFMDGSYELIVHQVLVEVAARVAVSTATSIGGKIGTTVRVIIVDGGDQINWEWKYGEGVVFPPAVPPSDKTH